MGVDIHPYSLKWEPFVAANEGTSDTLALLIQLANNDEAEVRPDSFEEPFCLAEEAAELYEGVRDNLPEGEREKWDQFLYASWWMPEADVLEQSPALKAITLNAIQLKGRFPDYIVRTLSPETVKHVAGVWRAIDQNVLLEAMSEAYDEDVLQDSFDSPEAVLAYLALWGEVYSLERV